jgi:hypothetical protein
MFRDQGEYDQFMAWAIEGSCLAQRMNACEGGSFEIPAHWHKYHDQAEKGLMPRRLPSRLENRDGGE